MTRLQQCHLGPAYGSVAVSRVFFSCLASAGTRVLPSKGTRLAWVHGVVGPTWGPQALQWLDLSVSSLVLQVTLIVKLASWCGFFCSNKKALWWHQVKKSHFLCLLYLRLRRTAIPFAIFSTGKVHPPGAPVHALRWCPLPVPHHFVHVCAFVSMWSCVCPCVHAHGGQRSMFFRIVSEDRVSLCLAAY